MLPVKNRLCSGLYNLFHPAILDGRAWSKVENIENTEHMEKMENIYQMT